MSKDIRGFRGSLDAYYQVEQDDGSFGPVYRAGNLTNFGITPDAEDIEITSTGNDDYGQALDTMVDAKPTKASFTTNRFGIDLLAMAFMGEVSARTGTETEVTDEPVAVVPGEIARVANLDISDLELTHTTGTPAYVLNTDYEIIDAELGLFRPFSGGAIVEGNVHADYTAAAPTGWLLNGGVKSSRFIRLFGRGINRFTNKRSIVTVSRGSIRPSGGFSFVGTDPASIGYEMTCNVPADGSPAFTVVAQE